MEDQTSIVELTAEIVANYVANNTVAIEDLPSLIKTINSTMTSLGAPAAGVEPPEPTITAAQIKKSIKPDGLTSFIDGRSYKTLKRHISKHGMTVQEYKEKFGLPKDYPTTSAAYSAKRSEMAKSLGLGRQPAVAIKELPPKATKVPKAPKASTATKQKPAAAAKSKKPAA